MPTPTSRWSNEASSSAWMTDTVASAMSALIFSSEATPARVMSLCTPMKFQAVLVSAQVSSLMLLACVVSVTRSTRSSELPMYELNVPPYERSLLVPETCVSVSELADQLFSVTVPETCDSV
ncbi:MAG: hypothetical protein QM820_46885 [Minicystis sp.]